MNVNLPSLVAVCVWSVLALIFIVRVVEWKRNANDD